MSSRKNADVDFERDVPTTPADVRALELARAEKPLPTEAYLQWLSRMPKTPTHPWHRNTDDDEPFEL